MSARPADRELLERAHEIRYVVLRMCRARGQGYAGQGLELADMVACLLHGEMRRREDGSYLDRFVLSTGHSAIALFAGLHTVGDYTLEELLTYGMDGSPIEESPLEDMRGFEVTGGSLGQGPSQAAGLALGERMLRTGARVYCQLSDGELQEGAVWEAFMFATHRRLGNLCFLVDNNGEQADGATAQILGVEPVEDKLASFGLRVRRIDGNSVKALMEALSWAREEDGSPAAIVCDTRPGKGVPSLESYEKVHYVRAPDEVWERALAELREAAP
jgi:transketolase